MQSIIDHARCFNNLLVGARYPIDIDTVNMASDIHVFVRRYDTDFYQNYGSIQSLKTSNSIIFL
jgi:hypothetical protein